MSDDTKPSPSPGSRHRVGWRDAAILATAAAVSSLVGVRQCSGPQGGVPSRLVSPGFTSKTNEEQIVDLKGLVNKYIRAVGYTGRKETAPDDIKDLVQSKEAIISFRSKLAAVIASPDLPKEVREAVTKYIEEKMDSYDLNRLQSKPEKLKASLAEVSEIIGMPIDYDEIGAPKLNNPALFALHYHLVQLGGAIMMEDMAVAEKKAGLETAEVVARRLRNVPEVKDNRGVDGAERYLSGKLKENLQDMITAAIKGDEKALLLAKRDFRAAAICLAGKGIVELNPLRNMASRISGKQELLSAQNSTSKEINMAFGLPESTTLMPDQLCAIDKALEYAKRVANSTPDSMQELRRHRDTPLR